MFAVHLKTNNEIQGETILNWITFVQAFLFPPRVCESAWPRKFAFVVIYLYIWRHLFVWYRANVLSENVFHAVKTAIRISIIFSFSWYCFIMVLVHKLMLAPLTDFFGHFLSAYFQSLLCTPLFFSLVTLNNHFNTKRTPFTTCGTRIVNLWILIAEIVGQLVIRRNFHFIIPVLVQERISILFCVPMHLRVVF